MRVPRVSAQIALIVTGTFTIVALVFLGMLIFHRPPTLPELHEAWRTEVIADVVPLLSGSPSADRVRTAKDRMLLLTVAPQDRDAHLAIVMALLALERGEASAQEKLRIAVEQAQR